MLCSHNNISFSYVMILVLSAALISPGSSHGEDETGDERNNCNDDHCRCEDECLLFHNKYHY